MGVQGGGGGGVVGGGGGGGGGWGGGGWGGCGCGVCVWGVSKIQLFALPDLHVQKVEIAHIGVPVLPLPDEILHVGHARLGPAPHAPVERALVVRVVAERVQSVSRRDPLLDGEPLSWVQPRVGVSHDETVH